MTARDICWRAGGVALLATAGAAATASGTLDTDGGNAAWALLIFTLAAAGAVLLIQGRHVALALRVERGRHRHLPSLLRARHRGDTPDRR
jgi:cytochrome c oxidase assembly factor CtaG